MDELLTDVEFARRASLSTHTIRALLRQGRLQRTKVLSRTRIRASELAKLIVDGAGPSKTGFAHAKVSVDPEDAQ